MKCLECHKETGSIKKYCNQSCKNKYMYRNSKKIKRCKCCNESFEGSPGKVSCSKECSLKLQQIHSKKCPVCNKSFNARGNGVYCSKECYRKFNDRKKQLITTECKICSQNFFKKKNDDSVVCSDLCKSKLFDFYLEKTVKEIYDEIS